MFNYWQFTMYEILGTNINRLNDNYLSHQVENYVHQKDHQDLGDNSFKVLKNHP